MRSFIYKETFKGSEYLLENKVFDENYRVCSQKKGFIEKGSNCVAVTHGEWTKNLLVTVC